MSLPQVGWGQFQGDWSCSTSTWWSCSLSAHFRFRQTRTAGWAGTWTVWLQLGMTQLCLHSRSANRRRWFKQTLNKKEKQQDPCAQASRWTHGHPTCSVTLLSFHPGPSLLGVDPNTSYSFLRQQLELDPSGLLTLTPYPTALNMAKRKMAGAGTWTNGQSSRYRFTLGP